jgi:hypothetical protein
MPCRANCFYSGQSARRPTKGGVRAETLAFPRAGGLIIGGGRGVIVAIYYVLETRSAERLV